MMKNYITQFVVQFLDTEKREVELEKMSSSIKDSIGYVDIHWFIDCRTYTFDSIGFVVFSLISTEDFSPVILLRITKALEEYPVAFSVRSQDFDLSKIPSVTDLESDSQLGDFRA